MNKYLEARFRKNRWHKFQNCQTIIFRSLLDRKYNKVLEVGCGKGYFSYIGAKYGNFGNCYGCDIFQDYQKVEIKEYCKSVEYKHIKDDNLPYNDLFFDVVFSMDVMEHILDDVKFIKENIRVCKKGGQIIIGTPNYFRLTNVFLKLFGRLKYPRKVGMDSYGDVVHLREYKKNDLLKLLNNVGKQIDITSIEIIPCWFGLMWLNIGIDKMPKILENICQFWFVKFNKK